jgi:hypothetical protein
MGGDVNEREELMAELHAELLKELLRQVKSGEATGQMMSVARQFLKDNDISALLEPGGVGHELAAVLPYKAEEDDPIAQAQ